MSKDDVYMIYNKLLRCNKLTPTLKLTARCVVENTKHHRLVITDHWERDSEPPPPFILFQAPQQSPARGSRFNGFSRRKHPEGGVGVGQRKRGTEGSSQLFVLAWIEEREEKRWSGRGQ